jgi:hypothetical protein
VARGMERIAGRAQSPKHRMSEVLYSPFREVTPISGKGGREEDERLLVKFGAIGALPHFR